MSNLNGRIIVPSLAFEALKEDAFMSRVNAIEKGVDGNPAYDALPVPLPVFKAAIAAYTASNAAALDGSKKAIEDRKKKRADLTVMLRALGHYVEVACKGDMTVFLSSGFEPVTRTPSSAPQPLPQPTVEKVDQRVIYGTVAAVMAALALSSVSDNVNTVFIERQNGTDRHRNARKARKTYRFSKISKTSCSASIR